ncbi:hypothetical protein L6164_004222 [Bauhinia variegata]|uniref:Uncharacterized protein n=1 Tax=Bauhinia variegata TaxID=167791 RepID=A0ACB9Q3S4_BAUVA|nr:hypothetical protein L6164_004222 [Bauhinia variegata]
MMAGNATLSSTSILLLQNSLPFPSQISKKIIPFLLHIQQRKGCCFPIVVHSAKRKLSFVDQILDYIEDLPKDEPTIEDEDDCTEDEVRDVLLVADGESQMG